ncbi:copper chaperone PCu(A)C [Agrobacterium rosae]|uniref:Copper chaperone PCu(A)C n=1 Tax=Agrobacterium rosae TaxID=1972867 RepID=A0AAW9FRM3_9HYPH|nr:copper chaperone PCu(A)C [Agrobacterium rosae]MDX8305463.1 copper chaperone PCu(A)C [Agrobacterium rosae]
MNLRIFASGAIVALLATTGVPVSSGTHDFKAGSLELKHPWSAKAPPVAPVLGAYLMIVNTGSEADRLVGGSTPAAERLELHESTLVDGVARMRPAKQGIEIQAGETVKLEPGGAHIMLVNPRQRPGEGEKFKATLQFEKAGPVEVEFVVQKKTEAPSASQDHGAHTKP